MDNLPLLENVVRQILGRPELELAPNQRIAEISKWDSVAMVQILLMIENQEGIQFDTVDIAHIKTVGDILALLDKQL